MIAMTLPARMLHRARGVKRSVRTLLTLAIVMMAWTGVAPAHNLEQSYIFLRVSDTSIAGQFELGVPELNRALGLSLARDLPLSDEVLATHRERIEAYVREKVRLAPDGTPAAVRFLGISALITSFTQFVVLDFELEAFAAPATHLDVEYDAFFDEIPDHQAMLVIAQNWKTGTFDNESRVSLVFGPDERTKRLDLTEGSVLRGLAEMVKLGVHHILIGIDHIFFLLALLLVCVVRREHRRWEPADSARDALWNVVKVVTLFTVAHSITLALAATGIVQPPARAVESVIALSIAIVALDILYPVLHRHINWTVFVFGLFHGFGFASVLGEMGVPAEYLVLSLFGFNVGVELGQLGVVLLVFPLLFLLRGTTVYRRWLLPTAAVGLILVAGYWFVERAFDVDLPAGAILQSLLGMTA